MVQELSSRAVLQSVQYELAECSESEHSEACLRIKCGDCWEELTLSQVGTENLGLFLKHVNSKVILYISDTGHHKY